MLIWNLPIPRLLRAAEDGGGSGPTPESAPGAEGGAAAAAAVVDPPPTGVAEGAAAAPDSAEGGEAAAAAAHPFKPDWRDKRVAKKTAEAAEANRKLAELQAEVERLRAGGAGAAAGSPEYDQIINAEAERRARVLADQQAFNRECDAIAKAGEAAFPDFQARITDIRRMIGDDGEMGTAYGQLIRVAMKTGKAPELLHALGGDLNRMGELLHLPPADMGIELSKMAFAAAPQGDAPSSAPRPIKTIVGGRGAQHTPIDPSNPAYADGLSTAEWIRRRNEQERARKSA